MLKGNIGEWSELYAFVYLLIEEKLYAADDKLNINKDIYFPIIKIIREEEPEKVIDYKTGRQIQIYKDNKLIRSVDKSEFENIRNIILTALSEKTEKGPLTIESTNSFFESIFCTKLKANSTQKQDITIKIHDINTGYEPICGFSIKSYIGSSPTLINAGATTNFTFIIKDCDDLLMNTVNAINTPNTKIIDRMKLLSSKNLVIADNFISSQFKENLMFIDTLMPQLIATVVLYSYRYNLKRIKDIVKKLEEVNPFDFPNTKMYEYKFKKFLCAAALGMTPSKKHWEGKEDANGGYIVVKKNGDVVCYHIYNRADFEQYLFDYTSFDRAGTSRHHYMSVYKEGNEYRIKLNLQIRFNP